MVTDISLVMFSGFISGKGKVVTISQKECALAKRVEGLVWRILEKRIKRGGAPCFRAGAPRRSWLVAE